LKFIYKREQKKKEKLLLFSVGTERMLIICIALASLNPAPVLYFLFYNLMYGLIFLSQHLQSGGRRYPLNTVWCAALNTSAALAYPGIALLVPGGYRGRSQTGAGAGAGDRKG
jgi:hypothetical protein